MSLALFTTLLANPLVLKGMFYYPLIKLQDDFRLHCINDSLAALFIADKTYSQLSQPVTIGWKNGALKQSRLKRTLFYFLSQPCLEIIHWWACSECSQISEYLITTIRTMELHGLWQKRKGQAFFTTGNLRQTATPVACPWDQPWILSSFSSVWICFNLRQSHAYKLKSYSKSIWKSKFSRTQVPHY